jgi:hypothetical protein
MSSPTRFLTLPLVFLVLTSLIALTVVPATVQAESKLSVPQFSLKLVDNPWIISPIQTTDPYTGVAITQPGYQIERKVIEITIKNQNYPGVMYSVRTKGHFEQEWHITHGHNGAVAGFAYQSGKYTVVELDTTQGMYKKDYPDGAQVDVQVMALQGSYERRQVPGIAWVDEFFEGVTSDWSKTQTITITYGSLSSSQTATLPPPSVTFEGNQTQSYSQMSLLDFVFTEPVFLLVISVLFVGVAVAVVMIILKKIFKTSNLHHQ